MSRCYKKTIAERLERASVTYFSSYGDFAKSEVYGGMCGRDDPPLHERHRVIEYCEYLFIYISDIDECSAESSPCDENAECTNSDGSFSCLCKQGFTGDGKTCQGT